MFRKTNGSANIHWSEWDDLGFTNLFTEQGDSDISHLPIREQLRFYKKRDLRKTKWYNIRMKCWGIHAADVTRRRVFNASSDQQSEKLQLGKFHEPNDVWEEGIREFNDNRTSETYMDSVNKRKAKLERIKSPKEEKANTGSGYSENNGSKTEQYKCWVESRMKLRSDLDNIVNYEEMINQSSLNPLQALVAQRFMESKYPKNESPKELDQIDSDSEIEMDNPEIERPVPDLYCSLENYLKMNNLRWVDLFAKMNCKNRWEVDRVKIKSILEQVGAHVSMNEVDDFIDYFDECGSGKLSYKQLMSKRANLLQEQKLKRRESAVTPENLKRKPPVPKVERRKSNPKSEKGTAKKKLSREVKTNQESEDNNVAVFAAYENDPQLYKLKIIRRSSQDRNAKLRPLRTSSLSYHPSYASSNKPISRASRTPGSSCSSNSQPLYKRLPSKLQPIDYVFIENDRLNPPISPIDKEISYPGENNCKPPDKFISSERKLSNQNHPSVDWKLDGKMPEKFREMTFTSMTSNDSPSKGSHLAFRKRCWEEFTKIKHLFESNGLVMSETALEKALLYPKENTVAKMKKSVRPPRNADFPLKKKPQIEDEEDEDEKKAVLALRNRSESSKIASGALISKEPSGKSSEFFYQPKVASDIESEDYKISKPGKPGQHFNPFFLYPKQKRPSVFGTVEELSTGSSLVKPRTDCWMTFDEYMSFCRQLNPRDQIISAPNKNAFWPGYMLDKLTLVFTGRERSSDNIFMTVKR